MCANSLVLTLGNINIVALSEAGKALQDWADSVSNNYRMEAIFGWYSNNSWENVDPAVDAISEQNLNAAINTENYHLDWVFDGKYNAIALTQAEGEVYGFDLVDADDAVLPSDTALSLDEELAKATDVELGDRVSSAYLTDYFVIEDLLDVSLFEEVENDDGSVSFTSTEGEVVLGMLGSLLSYNTTNYTGVEASMSFDAENEKLTGWLHFNDSDANFLNFSITTKDVGVALLDAAVANLVPPEPLDVTALSEHIAAFAGNFTMDFQVGIFNSSLSLISNFYQYNTVGGAVVDDDTWAYYSQNFDVNEEGTALVLAEPSFGGFYVNKEEAGGVYLCSADEEGKLAKNETAMSGSDGVNDPAAARGALGVFNIEGLTKAVLEGASLSSPSENVYVYDATFDSLALGAIAGGELAPISYSFFSDPENAQYIFGQIIDAYEAQGMIQLFFAQRVNLGASGSGYQGVKILLRTAGTSAVDLGDDLYTLFDLEKPTTPEPEPEPWSGEVG